MVNTRLLALLAVPAALALPVARPDEHSLAKCDIYFEKPVITNPEELKSYQPTQNDGDSTTTTTTTTSSSYSSANTTATPLPQTPSSGSTPGTSTYQCFSNGNYPAPSTWPSFATLWSLHASAITTANSAVSAIDTSSGSVSGGGSSTTTQILHDKILLVASSTSVDARLILATILQESGGALAVPCTGTGNCGLMQGPPGSASYDGGSGDAAALIEQMIRDGVQGTPGTWPNGGPGLEYWLDVYGGGDDEPWKALRAYNTGSVPDGGDLSVTNGVGTESYVVDVANRLVGWDGVQRGSC